MFSKQPWMYKSSTDFYDFNIDNSLIFDKDSSNKLSFTQGTPTDISKWTVNFWFKTTEHTATFANDYVTLWSVEGPGTTSFSFIEGDIHFYLNYNSSGSQLVLKSNAKFRDPSAWYNFHVKYDRDNSTVAEKLKIFVNGTDLDSFGGWQTDGRSNIASNTSTGWNVNSAVAGIGGRISNSSRYFSGYLSQFYNIDGQALNPSSFAELKDNIWKPKEYTGTFGNNGWLLEFKQTGTGTGSTTTVGADTSGRGNHFDSTNIVSSDVVSDSPTQNFSTLNPIHNVPATTFSEGNLRANITNVHKSVYATHRIQTGTDVTNVQNAGKKYYFEAHAISGSNNKFTIGLTDERNTHFQQSAGTNHIIAQSGHNSYLYGDAVSLYHDDIRKNGTVTASNVLSPLTGGDIAMIAFDAESGKVWFGRNGTWVNGSASTSTTLDLNNHDTTVSVGTGKDYLFGLSAENCNWIANFGQDPTFAGTKSSSGNSDGTTGSFFYAPPTDFVALNTLNMPNPSTVADPLEEESPTDYFNTLPYPGDGTTSRSITGVGFAPDFVWLKSRSHAEDHGLSDTVRGATNKVEANNATAEETSTSSPTAVLTAFGSDGFTGPASSPGNFNVNGRTYVAWNWKAGGAASANNNGTIQSSVSASTESGFSIVSYTGAGGSSATVGHGLTAAPDCIWLKNRTAGEGWVSFWNTPAMGPTKFLGFNSTGAAATSSGEWNNTAPTNTVFTIGNQGRVNTNNHNYIAYCFHNVEGFCKVSQHRGNGSSDGPVVHCGFRPAFILIKSTASGTDWAIYDNKRLGYNVDNNIMRIGSASSPPTEQTDDDIDILSNGFKFRRNSPNFNGSGTVFVFIAFAEQPFKYANAR